MENLESQIAELVMNQLLAGGVGGSSTIMMALVVYGTYVKYVKPRREAAKNGNSPGEAEAKTREELRSLIAEQQKIIASWSEDKHRLDDKIEDMRKTVTSIQMDIGGMKVDLAQMSGQVQVLAQQKGN